MNHTGLSEKIRASKAVAAAGLLLAASAFSACSLFEPSPPFSKSETRWADREILFRDVEHHKRAMEGQRVVLGGKIITVKRGTPESLIFVQEYPLDKEFNPETDQQSRGDFAIETDLPLPKDRYKPGHTIEVIGEVRAPIPVAMGEKQVKHIPLVRARHLHAQAPAPPPDPMMMDPGFMDPGMMGPGFMGPGFFGPGMMGPGFF